jgi:hypothetical protein
MCHHPSNRAERRHERERVIARRRKVAEREWGYNDYWWIVVQGFEPYANWGRYDKSNGNCNSKLCHGAKYLGRKDRRRKALKQAESQAEFRKKDKVVGHM